MKVKIIEEAHGLDYKWFIPWATIVNFEFDTLEEAIAHCKENNVEYTIEYYHPT